MIVRDQLPGYSLILTSLVCCRWHQSLFLFIITIIIMIVILCVPPSVLSIWTVAVLTILSVLYGEGCGCIGRVCQSVE